MSTTIETPLIGLKIETLSPRLPRWKRVDQSTLDQRSLSSPGSEAPAPTKPPGACTPAAFCCAQRNADTELGFERRNAYFGELLDTRHLGFGGTQTREGS